MISLALGSTILWYGSLFLSNYFLSSGVQQNLLGIISQFLFVFFFSIVLILLLLVTKLYLKRYLMFFISLVVLILFYWQKWLGADFFNYYSLFLTNLLYCMMIFYSLPRRSLL